MSEMSYEELQYEERVVLLSIYDGDKAFKQLSPTVFQYKYGEHDNPKSFLVELQWTESYPSEKPVINMDTFYNRHLLQSIKDSVAKMVSEVSELYLGDAMTYSLFEFIKQKYEELIENQPEHVAKELSEGVETISISNKDEPASKKPVKKEQLSKAQKRKQWDRVEAKGEKPRGWDWIDVVKHLSQTGAKDSEPLTST